MTDVVMVYMTMASREEAERIGRALVEERMAACVNIGPAIQSFFYWEGQVQSESEVAVLAKTRRDQVQRLNDRVCELHSYDCPCLVTVPIEQGHTPFLAWVLEQTSSID